MGGSGGSVRIDLFTRVRPQIDPSVDGRYCVACIKNGQPRHSAVIDSTGKLKHDGRPEGGYCDELGDHYHIDCGPED